MDFIKDLNIDKVRNLAEDAFNQVKPKNDVEARVYEVLSHKNWGASTTLMNEIAQDTYDYERFLIVTKLMWEAIETPRPSAWRVIFKGLTLLEHLVKNGSERCVDDARNHSHLLRNLDRFNYYEGTVDRGVGVREKSKQIVEILGDDERIREERGKARQLRDKFAGKQSTASSSNSGGSGGRMAGYGNSDANWASSSGGGGGSNSRGGGGGGYGESGIGSSNSGNRGRYGQEGTVAAAPVRSKKSSKSSTSSSGTKVKKVKKKEKKVAAPAPAAPEVDLFGFDEPATSAPAGGTDDFDAFQTGGPAPVNPALAKPPAATPAAVADDFGDFQQIAPTSAVQFDAFGSAPAQQQQSFDAFSTQGVAPGGMGMMQQPQQPNHMGMQGGGGNVGMMNNAFGNMSMGSNSIATPTMNNMAAPPANNAAEDNDDFGDFEDAPNSTAFSSPTNNASQAASSSDPMSKLFSLDGLTKNTKKKEKPKASGKPIDFSQPLGGMAGAGGMNGGGMSGGGFQQPTVMGTGQQGDVGEVFGQLMSNEQQQQQQRQQQQQGMMNQQQMGGNMGQMGGMGMGGQQQMNSQMGGMGMGGQQMNNTMGGMGGQLGGMMQGNMQGNMGMMGGHQGMMQGNMGMMGGNQQSMGGNNMGMMGGQQGQMNNNMMGQQGMGGQQQGNMMGGNMGMMGGQGFR